MTEIQRSATGPTLRHWRTQGKDYLPDEPMAINTDDSELVGTAPCHLRSSFCADMLRALRAKESLDNVEELKLKLRRVDHGPF